MGKYKNVARPEENLTLGIHATTAGREMYILPAMVRASWMSIYQDLVEKVGLPKGLPEVLNRMYKKTYGESSIKSERMIENILFRIRAISNDDTVQDRLILDRIAQMMGIPLFDVFFRSSTPEESAGLVERAASRIREFMATLPKPVVRGVEVKASDSGLPELGRDSVVTLDLRNVNLRLTLSVEQLLSLNKNLDGSINLDLTSLLTK